MRVLVADDDPVTRRQLSGLLETLGHDPVEAQDGLEAWQAIKGADAPPLLILDWMMPAPDGIEICQRLRGAGNRPYQYVLMLTARDTMDDLVQGMEAGADDYLRKPFDLRELRVRMRAGERVLALQDELLTRATTDDLTGLLNRRGVLERLAHELSLMARDARRLSVLLVDIDTFKLINDAHGHSVGDQVLKEVAVRMKAQLRAYDDIGRHGGEEFAVVLADCDASGAFTVAERMRQAVCDTPVVTSAGALKVTISVGVAAVGGGAPADLHGMLAAADRALYEAKGAGRNRVEVAAPAAQTPAILAK